MCAKATKLGSRDKHPTLLRQGCLHVLMRNDRNMIINFKAGEYIRKMSLSHSVTGSLTL